MSAQVVRGLRVVTAAAVLSTGMAFASVVPVVAGDSHLAVASADNNGKQYKVPKKVGWALAQELVVQAITFMVTSPSPNTAEDVLNQTLASAPRFSSVSDPQQIVWQAATIGGPGNANGVIYGDAQALFNGMAAAGQRTGDNSLRNGVYTVTLSKGTKSQPPVFTISNKVITKRIMVLS